MQKLDPNTDGKTLDIVADNIAKLKELFPEIVTEGKVDFEVLKEVLGEYVEDREERYSFTWNGKSRARMLAQTPSNGTLRPCPEESVNFDSTQNLFIEGDNLEVLKLLQKSYYGKIRLIYIDPPYNTGKDFIYPDNYRDSIKNYLDLTNQMDDSGRKFGTNAETSGRFHTDWLNMIFPRLQLARNLITEDGFIAVSIDDSELNNLILVMNEVFGEENQLATLVWDKNRKNDAKYFSVGHEYMVIFAKNETVLRERGIVLRTPKDGVEEVRAIFSKLRKKYNDDWDKVREGLKLFFSKMGADDPRKPLSRYTKVDGKGPYRDDGNINWPGGGGPTYDVKHPVTGKNCKKPTSGWRYPTIERFNEEVEKGRIVFGPDETTVPRVRSNLFESAEQVLGSVHYSYAQTATIEFVKLFNGKRVFDNPKSYKDMDLITTYLTSFDDIILDFFSGSCSTAHAVLEANARLNSDRKFIMVQLPEVCGETTEAFKAGYKTIADIGKDRIRKIRTKILEDNTGYSGDLGFKVFKLDSTNIKPWNADFDNYESSLDDYIFNIKPGRSEEDVLYEILLKYGLDLTLPIEERIIADKKVFIVGMGALVLCLADGITLDVVEGIADLKEELKPEVMRVVFKDNGFSGPNGDVIKTNAIQILRQHDITDVKSL